MDNTKHVDLELVNLYPPQTNVFSTPGKLLKSKARNPTPNNSNNSIGETPAKRVPNDSSSKSSEAGNFTVFVHVEDPESFTDHRASAEQGKSRTLNFLFGGKEDGLIVGLERSWHPRKSYDPQEAARLTSSSRQRQIYLKGHVGRISCMKFGYFAHRSKYNGGLLFSGSADRTIKVWDPSLRKQHGENMGEAGLEKATGGKGARECIQTMVGHNGTINQIEFCEMSKSLFSCSVDGSIIIWREPHIRRTSLLLYPWFENLFRIQLNAPPPSPKVLSSCLRRPFHNPVASRSTGDVHGCPSEERRHKRVSVLSKRCNSNTTSKEGETGGDGGDASLWWPSSIAISNTKQGTILFVADSLGYLRRFSVSFPNPSPQSSPPVASRYNMKLDSTSSSPNVAGGVDETRNKEAVHVSLLSVHQIHQLGITFISILPQQQLVVTLSYDNTARIFDAVNLAPFLTLKPPENQIGRFTSACWDYDNLELVLGTSTGGISIWNVFKEHCLVAKQLESQSPITFLASLKVTVQPTPQKATCTEVSEARGIQEGKSKVGSTNEMLCAASKLSKNTSRVKVATSVPCPASSLVNAECSEASFTHIAITLGTHIAEYEVVRDIAFSEFVGHSDAVIGMLCTSSLEKYFAWEPRGTRISLDQVKSRDPVSRKPSMSNKPLLSAQSSSVLKARESSNTSESGSPSRKQQSSKHQPTTTESTVLSILNQLRAENATNPRAIDGGDGMIDRCESIVDNEVTTSQSVSEPGNNTLTTRGIGNSMSDTPSKVKDLLQEHDKNTTVLLFTASQDNTIKCWDQYDTECQYTLTGTSTDICAFKHVRLGSKAHLVTGHEDGTIVWWDPAAASHKLLKAHRNSVSAFAVAYLERISYLISADYDGEVCFWEMTHTLGQFGTEHVSPHLECSFQAHNTNRCNDTISHIVPGLVGGGNEILAMCTAILLHSSLKYFKTLQSDLSTPAWSHNGDVFTNTRYRHPNAFLTGSSNGTVHVWNLSTQNHVTSLDCHQDAITCMECHLSCVGPILFTGSDDNQVLVTNVHNLAKPQVLYRISGHSRPIKGLQYVPGLHEGNLLTCSLDGTAKLWHCPLLATNNALRRQDTMVNRGTVLSVEKKQNVDIETSTSSCSESTELKCNLAAQEAKNSACLVFKFVHNREIRCIAVNPITLDMFVGTEEASMIMVKLPVHRVRDQEDAFMTRSELTMSMNSERGRVKITKKAIGETSVVQETVTSLITDENGGDSRLERVQLPYVA